MELSDIPAGLSVLQQITYLTGAAAQVRTALTEALQVPAVLVGAVTDEESLGLSWAHAHEVIVRAIPSMPIERRVRDAVEDAVGAAYTSGTELTRLVDSSWAPLSGNTSEWVTLSPIRFQGDVPQGFESQSAQGFVSILTNAYNVWPRLVSIPGVLPSPGGVQPAGDDFERALQVVEGGSPFTG